MIQDDHWFCSTFCNQCRLYQILTQVPFSGGFQVYVYHILVDLCATRVQHNLLLVVLVSPQIAIVCIAGSIPFFPFLIISALFSSKEDNLLVLLKAT